MTVTSVTKGAETTVGKTKFRTRVELTQHPNSSGACDIVARLVLKEVLKHQRPVKVN